MKKGRKPLFRFFISLLLTLTTSSPLVLDDRVRRVVFVVRIDVRACCVHTTLLIVLALGVHLSKVAQTALKFDPSTVCALAKILVVE